MRQRRDDEGEDGEFIFVQTNELANNNEVIVISDDNADEDEDADDKAEDDEAEDDEGDEGAY